MQTSFGTCFNITNFGRPRQFSIDKSGQAWIYYYENPLNNPLSSSGSRFGSVFWSYLGYSLTNHNLLSSIHIGNYPESYNTSLVRLARGLHYYYNDSYELVQLDHPVVYFNRIITPLFMRVNFEYYFIGFRVYSFSPIYQIQSIELQTLVISFTVFLGISTYTVILSVKKKNSDIEMEEEST